MDKFVQKATYKAYASITDPPWVEFLYVSHATKC